MNHPYTLVCKDSLAINLSACKCSCNCPVSQGQLSGETFKTEKNKEFSSMGHDFSHGEI